MKKSIKGTFGIPAVFSIKGRFWTVIIKKDLYYAEIGAVNGLCSYSDKTIYLDESLSPVERLRVFIHELVHATIHECHLNEAGGIQPIVEEILCSGLADVIVTDLMKLK